VHLLHITYSKPVINKIITKTVNYIITTHISLFLYDIQCIFWIPNPRL